MICDTDDMDSRGPDFESLEPMSDPKPASAHNGARPDQALRTDLSVPEALAQWREAERTAAVARRGRLAAQIAAQAAADAAQAAEATSIAARTSLEAATAAELSASKTAHSARIVAEVAQADLADADAEMAVSDLAENAGQKEYRDALQRADDRTRGTDDR